MEALYAHVDARRDAYIRELAEAVAVRSVSSDPARRADTMRMMDLVRDKIVALGGAAELQPNPMGTQPQPDGTELPLPGILTGCYPATPVAGLKTILVYGHLDVQPADVADGWASDPWVLQERDGRLYARGATDDKGPVLAWLWAIQAFQALGCPLPVNVKFIFEGMEESGSEGFDLFCRSEANTEFFQGISGGVVSDNYWLSSNRPCVTYGLRGLTYFMVTVCCAKKDMHSGVYGGAIHEAMHDMVKLLASLNNDDGSIAVPGIYDAVAPMTPAEEATYASIDFDPAEFAAEAGVPNALRHPTKQGTLTARWRYPTLSVHGIEGAWSGPGAKTVIPHTVVGKFSLRLVPHQEPADIEAKVRAHLAAVWAGLRSVNTMAVAMEHGAKAWVSPVDSWSYVAARRAVTRVFGVEPDLTREGGSIPIVLDLEAATGASVLLLPIGSASDGAHSTNESIPVLNLLNGVKVLATYLEECGAAVA